MDPISEDELRVLRRKKLYQQYQDYLDQNDGSVDKTQSVSQSPSLEKGESKVDSGLSSIEKSKAVKPELTPSMSSPILSAPDQKCMAFAIASVDASGVPNTTTIHSFILKGEEIKNSVLKGWMNNLREIEEYVRQILASPMYRQLQDIRRLDQQSTPTSSVEGVSSSNAAGRQQVELLSTLDRWQVLEKIPPTAQVTDTSAPQDSRVLIIPLTAALLAGGGLALGVGAMDSIHSLEGIMGMLKQIQPLFPSVSIQDLVPLINLMVVGPIYYNSWNEAVSKLKSRKGGNYGPVIQNFAKDVIKIVGDPNFVRMMVERMRGTEGISSVDQERLTGMLKIVLIGVALSLLYSLEVGKVQEGTFGGIEPEEFRDLILGKFENLPDSGRKEDLQSKLTSTLIASAREQLKALSESDRIAAAEMVLAYLTTPKDLDPMLNPAKVFEAAIQASDFDTKEKLGPLRA